MVETAEKILEPERLDCEVIADALRIHDLGFSLIPIKPGAKKPSLSWKQYQEVRATRQRVRYWLERQWPGVNYAVITGQVSGVVAVEADDDEAVRLLHERFPLTPLRQRSRKGEHWVYRHPGVRVSNRVRCRVGGRQYHLDIRGDGGYIIGPGSRHPSGHIYTEVQPWTAEALALTPVFDPTWIDPRPARKAPARKVPTRTKLEKKPADSHLLLDGRQEQARQWLQTGWHGGPVPGTRQGQAASGSCFWIACRLVHGFDLTPEEALPLLAEWGQRADQLDEDGGWYPWTEAELLHKLEDADRQEDARGRPRGYALGLVLTAADIAKLEKLFFRSRL